MVDSHSLKGNYGNTSIRRTDHRPRLDHMGCSRLLCIWYRNRRRGVRYVYAHSTRHIDNRFANVHKVDELPLAYRQVATLTLLKENL